MDRDFAPVAYPHVRTGRLRALAITSPERSSLALYCRIVKELGIATQQDM